MSANAQRITRHIGIFCLPGRGHLYPAVALGRRLEARGHRVTFFNRALAGSIVRDAGLNFQSVPDDDSQWPNAAGRIKQRWHGPNMVKVIESHALSMLKHAPAIVDGANLDALIVDQGDLAGSTIAELLRIPFVNVSFFPPVYLDDANPPIIFDWHPGEEEAVRLRNRRGNAFFRKLFEPALKGINAQRREWAMPEFRDLNELFSTRAIVAQLPAALDFPRPELDGRLFHAGPFVDFSTRRRITFPCEHLDGRPLVYVTMGTVRYNVPDLYRRISIACKPLNVQLVFSTGGMTLMPEQVDCASTNSIVIHYAPQDEILARACLTICHGGMNTTLESLARGVPVIAIPITDDQPGVAARIQWHRVGLALPLRKASVWPLQKTIEAALADSEYRSRARDMQSSLAAKDGLASASDVIESACGLRDRTPADLVLSRGTM